MSTRSKLFVSGSHPELFAKAACSEADRISVDFEDAVAQHRKEDARAAVFSFLRSNPLGPGKVSIVRVNATGTPWFERNIAAAVDAGADIVNLPKVESAADIHVALAAMARAGYGSKKIGLLANIETSKGIRLAAEIAAAEAQVIGLYLGLVDLFLPLGIARNEAARGSQAFVVDGELIDAPMIAHARSVMEAARRHEAAANERTHIADAG